MKVILALVVIPAFIIALLAACDAITGTDVDVL